MLASLMLLGAALLPHTESAAFISQPTTRPFNTHHHTTTRHMSSFVGDGSDYSSKDSDVDEDDELDSTIGGAFRPGRTETPTIELSPVPMSKNSGNRFVAFIWDQALDKKKRDVLELHYDRIQQTEDHVMFCRKRNLYNETFNAESMVDILWSYPM